MINHPINPVYDNNSNILILGSFPSVKSREYGFYYGHPQNRFWKVISAIYGEDIPDSIEAKKDMLIRNKIAVWDVIGACDITGSADSSIKNVVPNDLSDVLSKSNIHKIYLNGKTADKLYKKYIERKIEIESYCLPSTSPANAAWNLEKLISAWKVIKE